MLVGGGEAGAVRAEGDAEICDRDRVRKDLCPRHKMNACTTKIERTT